MGRLTNEKCWACSLLTATEARKLHDDPNDGDRCWRDDTCHSRRSYYRQGRGRVARRNSVIEEVTVPIPDFPYVVLHTYLDKPRQPNDEVVIQVVLQKLVEDRKLSKCRSYLYNHSKDLVDEFDPFSNGFFFHSKKFDLSAPCS